jgi:hypothetical protein
MLKAKCLCSISIRKQFTYKNTQLQFSAKNQQPANKFAIMDSKYTFFLPSVVEKSEKVAKKG